MGCQAWVTRQDGAVGFGQRPIWGQEHSDGDFPPRGVKGFPVNLRGVPP